ncbi:TERF1 (TRF1)-interacting nuclear factor 2 L homeolog isoform X1 [Xenopus laevis]|uniref:TERF1 (TRF1)-interacting nuclear factor 2 L homeolog isoform X1 n=1 Tax=Xenopus laevis TaxID=8355 RepID=A0A8J0U6R3_XENLA|nr:TERF1 (TRF1)-interacting nuclear factor 2 L homeolog isoform X1 [Xenopus laevis]
MIGKVAYLLGSAESSVNMTPDLPAVTSAIWQVMQRRETQHFGRVLEFLELVHAQVPDLLCYRHHAKLSVGLRGKMVLDMVEKSCSLMSILTALNLHFPPSLPDEPNTVLRDHSRLQRCHSHFRKLVLRLIRDDKFRSNYIETKLQSEYGETFMASLEKLLWEFLYRLQTVLIHQPFESPEESQLTPTQLPGSQKQDMSKNCLFPVDDHTSPSCSLLQNDPHLNFSKPPATFTTEELKMRKNHMNKSCTVGDEEEQDLFPLQCETEQNSTQPKQTLMDSKASMPHIADSESSGNEALHNGNLVTDVGHHDAGTISMASLKRPRCKTSVFDIFGLDCTLEVDSYGNLSPPNPFQSQEMETLLGKKS